MKWEKNKNKQQRKKMIERHFLKAFAMYDAWAAFIVFCF